MKSLFSRFAAFLALAVYFPNVISAADYAQSFLAGQRSLDLYLERARVQTSQERFEAFASEGIQAALVEWEQSALELKLAGVEDWALQRQRALEDYENRRQGIFCEWVMERKKSEEEDIKKSALFSELRALCDSFYYVEKGGKQTRIVSEENILDAKAQWEARAEEVLQKYLGRDSSERAELDAYLVEMQALNELTNKLLYDHDSLKKMSDSEAALFIADKLASQIEKDSQAAVESLFNSLQSQPDFAQVGDVQAKKEAEENWLARFESELNLGLKKWNDAEEEFLAARSEWEREAERVYLNDNQKWQEAYNELQNRKNAWGQKIEAQIQAGREEWRNKLDVLEDEINQSLSEFQNALSWETEQKRQIVQRQEDAYTQTRAVLESAQRGVEIWFERWGPKYRGLYSYWKTEDNFCSRRDLNLVDKSYFENEICKWKENFSKSVEEIYCSICEKKYEEKLLEVDAEELLERLRGISGQPKEEKEVEDIWDIYPKISLSAESSAEEIWSACYSLFVDKKYAADVPEEFWQCAGSILSLWNASSELFEWIDLYDKFKKRADEALFSLYSDSCANIQIVDELDSERAKASWLVDYWECRVQIAQAVADYAQNDFSDLEWADQTEKALKAALDGYNAAKAEYQEAFDKAQKERSDVLSSRDDYFSALASCQSLLDKIDSERAAYDALYQQKLDILDSLADNTTLDLICQVEALNFSEEDFKKYLWRRCYAEQESFEQELFARAEQLRLIVEDGYEDLEDREDGQNATCLSIARLEELESSLLEILSSNSLDLQKARGLFASLKLLDAASVQDMEEKIAAFESADSEGAEEYVDGVRKALQKFLSIVQMECENRAAILLLLDGGAEEIHAFFDENESFLDIYEKYKEYSAALFEERSKACVAALKKVIDGGANDGLEEYFSSLDDAAEGASPFLLCALQMYKDLLLCKNDCAAVEQSIYQKAALCQSVMGNIQISPVDWFCDACEEFLLQENYNMSVPEIADELFEKVSFARKDLLFDLQDRFDFLLGSAQEIERLELELVRQGDDVQALQNMYEATLDEISSTNKNSKLNLYLSACDRYNNYLEECQKVFQRLEAARRDYRLAQEIFFYAQNEYLHGSYDPESELKNCQEALQGARSALDALNAIQQEKAGKPLEDFKSECLNYYKARVMLLEYDQKLAGQTEVVFKAQEAERAAAERLASEFVPQGYDAEVPAFAKDLVFASVGQDGSYSFSLNALLAPTSKENEDLLKDYFSNYCMTQKDIYQNEYLSTRAKNDALEFLESLQTRPYSLIDLAFSALFLKVCGNPAQADAWYKDGENPTVNDNYKIAYLPDSVQGVNVADIYHDSRLMLLAEAFTRVMSLGGEEDLAKYILHCDVCLSRTLDFDTLERNALVAEALQAPAAQVESTGNMWQGCAAASFALAGVFSLISNLPLGVGSWAIPIAAMHAATGAVFMAIANQLFSYLSVMRYVQVGCLINVSQWGKEYADAFDQWQQAKKTTQEEIARLNVLISGKSGLDGKKITWDDFKSSVQETFDSGTLGVDSSYFMSMFDSASGQKNLKNIFDSLSEKEDFYDVRSVLQKIKLVLQKNYLQKKDDLCEFVSFREGDLTFDKRSYYEDLLSFYSKDLLRTLPSAMNRRQEDYFDEAFLDYQSLAEEALEYSAKNRMARKEDSLLFVYADMEEQNSRWEEKNRIILDSAQKEWLSAQEKLTLSFNSWQKNFASEYQDSSAEWEKNYSDFLEQKEDWLFSQYLSQNAGSDFSYSTVQKMKSEFDSPDAVKKLLDSVSDAEKFSRLSELTQSLSSFAQNDSYCKNFLDKIDLSLIKDYNEALMAQKELEESLRAAAAKAAAQQSMASLEKRVNSVFDSILGKNRDVEKWELNLVREDGYTVDPLIHRRAIVDVSVALVQTKRQDVHRYEYFTAKAPEIDLDCSSWFGSSDWLVMKKVEAAQKKIQNWAEEIFGSDKKGKSGGSLEEHLGRAPEFIQNVDPSAPRERNVKDFGSGQLGKILLDFQWNSIVSSSGAADLAAPIYEQKYLDINGFALPSLRDVAGVVLDIVSSVTGITVLQFADDFLFGAIDVGMGLKSWDEVAQDIAKQGFLSGVTKAVRWAVSAAGSAAKNVSSFFKGGAGSQVLKGVQNAAAGYLDSVASNYVNAFDFASGKMDWEAAASSWCDASAIAGAAGGFVGQSLGAFNNLDANGLALNSKVFGDIEAMNSLVGSLTGEAINYLATGNLTLNLLNVKGVGLLEVGVSDGSFKAQFGQGGADLSAQALLTLARGAKTAERVSDLKNSGVETQALLNAANLLAYSGQDKNLALASDLFNQKRELLFESGDDLSPFGRSLNGAIILNKDLLSQGAEGQAMTAALAALQNLSQSDASLDSMVQVSAVLCAASNALGFDLSSVQTNQTIAALANAYKQNGIVGVYAIYAEAEKAAEKESGQERGLAQLLEQPWFQNQAENAGVLLGGSLSVQDYNDSLRQVAVEKWAAKAVSEYLAKKGQDVSAEEIKRVGDEARAQASREIVSGQANEKYGYNPAQKDSDIYRYGCTLATAAYIAYSITGQAATLSEANEILKENNLFVYGVDGQGVGQVNLLSRGDGYANAVNAIAGGDYLEKDGKDFSVSASVDGKDNRQSIFDRLIKNSKNQSEVYFSHMRVNDSHSVLFESMSYTDEKDYKSSTLSVMDPWQGGSYGPKSWSDISRADFYKLTQAGKELYELTRSALRSA